MKRKTSSKYKGVTRQKGKWVAQISIEGQRRGQYLGIFETETAAAKAFEEAAAKRDASNAE